MKYNFLFAGLATKNIICIIFAVVLISLFIVNYFVCEKVKIKFFEEESFFWLNNIFLIILLFLLIFGMVVFIVASLILVLIYFIIVFISIRRNKRTRLNTKSKDAEKYYDENLDNDNNKKNLF